MESRVESESRNLIKRITIYASSQLMSHATWVRIWVKFDGLAVAKRVQRILCLSRILVREKITSLNEETVREKVDSKGRVGRVSLSLCLSPRGFRVTKSWCCTPVVYVPQLIRIARAEICRGSSKGVWWTSFLLNICNPPRIRACVTTRGCIAMGLPQWPCEVSRNLARRSYEKIASRFTLSSASVISRCNRGCVISQDPRWWLRAQYTTMRVIRLAGIV